MIFNEVYTNKHFFQISNNCQFGVIIIKCVWVWSNLNNITSEKFKRHECTNLMGKSEHNDNIRPSGKVDKKNPDWVLLHESMILYQYNNLSK